MNRWLARLTTGAASDDGPLPDWVAWRTLGLSDLESYYMQNLTHAPGQPQLLVAPDLVPEVWSDLD